MLARPVLKEYRDNTFFLRASATCSSLTRYMQHSSGNPDRLPVAKASSRRSQSLLRQHEDAVSGARGGRGVRNEDAGCAFALHALAQQREHFPSAFGVEIAGRLVGEHQA